MPTRCRGAGSALALLALLALLAPTLASAQTPESDLVTFALRTSEGSLAGETLDTGTLKVSGTYYNTGNDTRVRLIAEALKDGAVAWSQETSFMPVAAGDTAAFDLPVENLGPGRYLFRAFVEVENGDMIPTEETRIEITPSAAAPVSAVGGEESSGTSGLLLVVLGAVGVTAAGVGVGIYDRSLHTRQKPLLSDMVILVTGLLGGLAGLLLAFKITKHPERHTEKVVYAILAVQAILFGVVVWFAF